MRQRTEEAREERQKISAKFRNYQTGMSDDDQSEVDKSDAHTWKEEIKQDPYIDEAKNIIVDMKR